MIRNRSNVRTLNRRLRDAHTGVAERPVAPADHGPGRSGHARPEGAAAPARRVAPPVHVDLPEDFDLSMFDAEVLDAPAPFEDDVEAAPAVAGPAAESATAIAAPVIDRPTRYGRLLDPLLRFVAFSYLCAIVAGVVVYKAAFIQMLTIDPFFATYGLIVSGYIVSPLRDLALLPAGQARRARAARRDRDAGVQRGGGDRAARCARCSRWTTRRASSRSSPSTTARPTARCAELQRGRRAAPSGRVQVIDFPENRGKRAAMAAGIRATDAEIVAFVDSDSVLEPDALRMPRAGLRRPEGRRGVRPRGRAQHARDVAHPDAGGALLRGLHASCKAAESVFSAVTCCSGCFSAYRREAILPHLEWWESQTFLGVESTFGDDRSLTNCVLRDWKVRYEEKRGLAHDRARRRSSSS